jgi:hypothetical protein
MTTRFDIGEKVYFGLEFGWVEKITISEGRVVYEVRMPDKSKHFKVESSLRRRYEREKEER